MDVAQVLENPTRGGEAIKCIDMHTTGEPTRIVDSGFQNPTRTLLGQREQAVSQHDHVRRRIMLEPRGHTGMYGAVTSAETELVQSGDAHIGVLFTNNGGFSTMCAHATIALGRFLYGIADPQVGLRGLDHSLVRLSFNIY